MPSYQATFKALSDGTRRQVIGYLQERDMSAGEIADKFNMSKPSISHHLNILKQADLISDRRQGQSIIYSLNTSVFETLLSWFMEIVGKESMGKESMGLEGLGKEELESERTDDNGTADK
ncbi:MAG TPA: autorepressor SdpR family transcription factor [Bacillota bacterium]|nr:autorepressor SdpR family transcription factor [Bacillota bacterium]